MRKKAPKLSDFDRTKPIITIDNQSTDLTDEQIKRLIPALQAQIDEDFRPAWGLTARLKFKPKTKLKTPHMQLIIKDVSDEKGDLGYHFREGFPVAYIFAKDAMADADDIDGLSTVISHELLEMIADPGVNLLAAQPPPGRARNVRIFSYEVCDPVEANSYKKRDVTVCDFVYPEWFEPEHEANEMQMDYLGVVSSPFQLAPGGYIDRLIHNEWKTIWGPTAKKKPAASRHRLTVRSSGRGNRKATP